MSSIGNKDQIFNTNMKTSSSVKTESPLQLLDSSYNLQFDETNRMSPMQTLSFIASQQLDKDADLKETAATPASVHDAHLIIDAFKISSRNSSPPCENIINTAAKFPKKSNNNSLAKSVFNMRVVTLNNMPTSNLSNLRQSQKQDSSILRAKIGSHMNTANSLDFLRQNLQDFINKEIDEILQRYIKTYFTPAVENIRSNNGNQSVNSEHLYAICRQVLEEAKKLYNIDDTMERDSLTPPNGALVTTSSKRVLENSRIRANKHSLFSIKRRGCSDTDVTIKPKKVKKIKQTSSGRSTPSKMIKIEKREGPKWDPARIKEDSLFIMGAKANKVLGLGSTRGRIYIKHPNLFRYTGDQSDKQWLYENGYMPATGGKAYMLLVEDIKELCDSPEYCDNVNLLLDDLVGFKVPTSLLEKVTQLMVSQRTTITPADIIVTKDSSLPFNNQYGDDALTISTLINPHTILPQENMASDDDSRSLPSVATPSSGQEEYDI